jgi:serine/threonine protein kinase
VEAAARGRFQIVGQLGEGSVADVFLCLRQDAAGIDKEVAVKRIHADHTADRLFVRTFLDEARVVAGLSHRNIAQLFEVGEDESGPYVAMEHVRGVSLATIIARLEPDGLAQRHAARLLLGVCDGLASAHAALDSQGEPLGIVHRGVKPTTVLVTIDGIAKLLDFGMAAARERLSNSQVAGFGRSLRYLAPEQISQGRLDQRTDVYAVGVTLYELTTGRHPFGTEWDPEVEVLDRVLNGEFPPPSQVVPGYPPALETIVLSAMAAEPSQRCPSARELGVRLEAFASSGEQACDETSLAAWIRQLCPDFTALTRPAEVDPPSRPTPPTVAAVPTGDYQQVLPTEVRPVDAVGPRAARMASLLLFAGLVAGGAVWAFQRGRLWAPASPPVAAPAPAPTPPAAPRPDPQKAASAYLEGAEGLINQRRFGLAREVLGKAAEVTPEGSPFAAQLAQLRERLDAKVAAAADPPDRSDPPPEAEAKPDTKPDIPAPELPPVYDRDRIVRMLRKVEDAAISLGGVDPTFARGITQALLRRLRPSTPIYPAASYYFIVREARLGHDRNTAASNLAAAQASGLLAQPREPAPRGPGETPDPATAPHP